ncbi:phage distal tail protein domain-containing protein [Faecalibacillus faecis]|uniref:phage distal tail protein domain-containing protein n=1 Tax=Faecalibacillus faecis TaxID=1982628 RepID=UPI00386C051F
MVRGFRLINEKGQSYSLMDIENYCLLTEPSGLGYSYSTEYEQLGNVFIENLRKFEQGQITGIVNCLKYDNFKELVDFIEKANSLKLAYKLPLKNGEKEYLKDVNIQSLSKTQIQTTGVISETIVFDCLSLWYEENIIIYDMQEQQEEIRWDFEWDSKFTAYDIRSLEYINQGHVEAPVLIEISGPVINPEIQLYVEGELYQKVPFNIEIEEYEKLLYGTKENDFYIYRQKTDGTLESLFNLDVIQFENDNVIRLPQNKSCELRLKADNEILNAQVTILTYFKAI